MIVAVWGAVPDIKVASCEENVHWPGGLAPQVSRRKILDRETGLEPVALNLGKVRLPSSSNKLTIFASPRNQRCQPWVLSDTDGFAVHTSVRSAHAVQEVLQAEAEPNWCGLH